MAILARRQGGALAARRVFVRVREHLFLSGGDARRPLAEARGVALDLAPIPAWADLRRARLARFAVQHLSGQGSLHVARHRADLRGAGLAAEAARAISAEQPARRAHCSRARRRAARRFLAPGLTPPNSAKARRSPTARRSARCSSTSASIRQRVRASRERGQQGAAQGRMRPGGRTRRHRRALPRDRRRRSLLGQRPARTGAGLGGGQLSPHGRSAVNLSTQHPSELDFARAAPIGFALEVDACRTP